MALISSALKPCAANCASLRSPVNCDNVLVRTSDVNQDFSPGFAVIESRKDLPLIETFFIGPISLTALSFSVPIFAAFWANALWNTVPPIPALTTEFQSSSETRPEEIACDNWYIAVDACCELEPERAARLAIPLIAATAGFKPTPAAVKVPIFLAISEKL